MTTERPLSPQQEQSVRLAFDISSYQNLEGSEAKRRIIEDLPAYAIEQGDLPDSEKTTSGVWLVQNNEVVHPELGPIINYISRRNELEEREYQAFLGIRELILGGEADDKICWFSPSGNGYSESRIVVYRFKDQDGQRRIYYYEFTGEHSFEELRAKANSLRSFSPGEIYFPTPESLIVTPVLVRGASLKRVVEAVASYEGAWLDVTLGKVEARMAKLKEIAEPIANQVVEEIKKQEDPIWIGARMEEQIHAKISWTISLIGGCGFSNNGLLSLMGVESFGNYQNHYSLTARIKDGQMTIIGAEKRVFAKNCGVCGGKLNCYISPGFTCPHCGKTYQGVC